jgi:hypothetical protein
LQIPFYLQQKQNFIFPLSAKVRDFVDRRKFSLRKSGKFTLFFSEKAQKKRFCFVDV